MSGVVDVRCGGCLVWWMSGVVDVWCGGCPILLIVWWMSGVVVVWCGGCPISPMVWWMSGVVDVWCGGCPVWWMSGVVDVLFYTRCGGCLVCWMSVWWMSYNHFPTIDCCSNRPGVFSRVKCFVRWIRAVQRRTVSCPISMKCWSLSKVVGCWFWQIGAFQVFFKCLNVVSKYC